MHYGASFHVDLFFLPTIRKMQRAQKLASSFVSASEMTYIVSSGALNSTHSLALSTRHNLTGKSSDTA